MMTNKPKISVIVPIYGVEKYLRQALDSLLAQALHELEIILIDDGSKDDCPVIIDEYAESDGRIIAIHKPNGGYGSACNVGLTRASGEYVVIFEPDDFLEPNMYEWLYNTAREKNLDVIKSPFYTYFDIAGKDPKAVANKWFKSNENPYKKPTGVFTVAEHPEFFCFHPSVWSCLYARKFIEQHKIRIEEIPGAGWTDNLFQVQTFCNAKRIGYVDTPFYYWRLKHEDDAQDLKDWTIPFKRTNTIFTWLKAQGITDENIWACLYKRTFTYFDIVLRIIKPKQLKEVHSSILKILSMMDKQIVQNNKYITQTERHRYYYYHFCHYFYFLKLWRKIREIRSVITTIRRQIISFHCPYFLRVQGGNWHLTLFGIQLGHQIYSRPAWLRLGRGKI